MRVATPAPTWTPTPASASHRKTDGKQKKNTQQNETTASFDVPISNDNAIVLVSDLKQQTNNAY